MNHLKRERQARGWSRAELARRAGMNATTVGLIECGRFYPYRTQLEKLALALGWPETDAERLLDTCPDGAAWRSESDLQNETRKC